jgi:hypothetical protein
MVTGPESVSPKAAVAVWAIRAMAGTMVINRNFFILVRPWKAIVLYFIFR